MLLRLQGQEDPAIVSGFCFHPLGWLWSGFAGPGNRRDGRQTGPGGGPGEGLSPRLCRRKPWIDMDLHRFYGLKTGCGAFCSKSPSSGRILGFGVALEWLWAGFRVAFGWLCPASRLRWLRLLHSAFPSSVATLRRVDCLLPSPAQTRNPNEARNPASQFALRPPPNATPSFRPTHHIRNRGNARGNAVVL